jgi:hypothetical protein
MVTTMIVLGDRLGVSFAADVAGCDRDAVRS